MTGQREVSELLLLVTEEQRHLQVQGDAESGITEGPGAGVGGTRPERGGFGSQAAEQRRSGPDQGRGTNLTGGYGAVV